VFVDSEFDAKKGRGERPGPPVCICAVEVDQDGREIEHRLSAPYPARPPWDRGNPFLTVGFALSAEAGSFLHVGWPFPMPAVDLYAEFMVIHNTEMSRSEDSKQPGPGLIQACQRYRVAGMDKAHKEGMRSLAYTKTDHTPEELALLQDYCIEDNRMVMRLYRAMRPRIDLLRAPIRGAFMMEIERIRWRGIPIDMPTYRLAEQRGPAAVSKMRTELNHKLGAEVYFRDVFKRETMFQVMRRNGIPIPVDPKTGNFSCATKLIKSMIETYPLLKHYYEDKRMVDALKNLKLEIGADDRNRCWFNPFGTKTGRNNPSTNRALFGLPHTMRSFMKPAPGMALAQIDYGAQEVGIAAALSGDPTLIEDYLSGDPYRRFAKDALGVLDPTEQQRQAYKAAVLGRIYGKGAVSLARDLGISRIQAQRIMDQMTARYPVLSAWLERVTTKAAHCVPITCVLGWSLAATGRPGEERTFLNFPMQANASELMRLVVVRASKLHLITCVHDSFVIEDTVDRIEQSVAAMQEIMRTASRDLFGGFELRADCKPHDIVRHPDYFVDKREREDKLQHWNRMMALITEEYGEALPTTTKAHEELLIYFVTERERVRKLKEAGAPRPWSEDPIFQRASFCNVEREHDRTTVWIRENWREPYRDDPDVWFLMLVARLINAPKVLGAISLPLPWDRSRFVAEMAARKAQGLPLERAAYTIPTGGSRYPNKFDFLAQCIFDPLWDARAHVRPRQGDTCQAFFDRLRDFDFLGDFLAGQVVADTKFVSPLSAAADWWTFVAPGPGSGRWLSVMRGWSGNPPLKDRAFLEEFARTRTLIAPKLAELGLELSAQDLQNCCCETFKLWRARTSGQLPRRRYRAADANCKRK
jgi:DNA polymerase I-like protein with 3'-5' exonuclease and polymerase domains